MKYKLVASNESGSSEVYQGENQTLVQVFRQWAGNCLTGICEARPISQIPEGMFIHKGEDQTVWEHEEIWEHTYIPKGWRWKYPDRF